METFPATSHTAHYNDYVVLARKYRPQDFKTLVGQDILVQTLSNALRTGRLAHAFLLTGVRGVGKTTTARILARALNCIGKDGKNDSPTVQPCGECEHCRAIAHDRHMDVLEMDAASHTGVDDIRELIENIRYAPVSARFKIYIIDEIHMLSKNAFNALLKTLEEPPAHIRFIFATTETRKIPVTVLSRCQRFTLKRVSTETLMNHYESICAQENVSLSPEAMKILARAADGSVRDGLSLLDQAIAHCGSEITAEHIQDMLGLADKAFIIDLWKEIIEGNTQQALSILNQQYMAGVEPLVVFSDMMELCHSLLRLSIEPESLFQSFIFETEKEKKEGEKLANSLSLPELMRLWQMLLKAVQEINMTPFPLQTAEIALIRIIWTNQLPTPAEIIKELEAETSLEKKQKTPDQEQKTSSEKKITLPEKQTSSLFEQKKQYSENLPEEKPAPLKEEIYLEEKTHSSPEKNIGEIMGNFQKIITILEEKREDFLAVQLKQKVHLIDCQQQTLTIRLQSSVMDEFAKKLKNTLESITGQMWNIRLFEEEGLPTLAEIEQENYKQKLKEAAHDSAVQKAKSLFPEAELIEIKQGNIL